MISTVSACACASALASASETTRAASVTASGPAVAAAAHAHGGAGAARGGLDRLAQIGGRVRREVLQPRADEPVRGVDGLGQARAVRLGQRQLAPRQRQILREAVVDLGGELAALALHRGLQQLAPQLRGRDAGGQLEAEQAQHGPAQRVDRGSARRHWR